MTVPTAHHETSMPAAPSAAGIGLREPLAAELLSTRPNIGWLEGHSENYFGAGGLPLTQLEQLRAHYPISLHGVGLSLGSAAPLAATHLAKLKHLVDRVAPFRVSEHMTWSGITAPQATFVPDLLPLPLTQEALETAVRNIQHVQETLQRPILIENPSSYLTYTEAAFTEPDFLNTVCQQAGCFLLLDVNNIHVSAHNVGFDAADYLNHIHPQYVQEIHLAGYTPQTVEGVEVLIDTHNHPVYPAVWQLYEAAISHCGDIPTLIEWDSDFPPLADLVAQAHKADTLKQHVQQKAAAHASSSAA